METPAFADSSRPLVPENLAREPNPAHACRILLIDDEEPNLRLLERVLERAGYDNFISTTDPAEAVILFNDFQPDLVLTDWLMPHVDGCAVIERLRAVTASDDYLPIVVLTADITPQTKRRALTAGATDFLTKPFDRVEVLLRIQNLLQARLSHLTVQRQNATLEDSVRQRTNQLEQALIDLRQSQKQAFQQERLAALGTMAGGIAHDFNNSLAIIIGFGELLLRDADRPLTGEQIVAPVTTMLTAAEDAAKIVGRLREFYRPDEAEDLRIPVNLNQLVEQAITQTQPRWRTAARARGQNITVTTRPGSIPFISCDPAEMREALTNLIFNAVDALPNGGAIDLRTRAEGASVLLEVSDTGTGMCEEVRQRCLEPFFTTKGQSGTGLGLAMVFGIVQRHSGSIEIESAPGQGTTFSLRLPIATAECLASPNVLQWSSRALHILVVDDQPIFSQLVSEHLREDCHTVEIACGGLDALKHFQASAFDLVITDHVMAGMNGGELARAIKKLGFEVPVILLTGYAGDPDAVKQYAESVDLVIGKPLSRASLRLAVATVMDRANPSKLPSWEPASAEALV